MDDRALERAVCEVVETEATALAGLARRLTRQGPVLAAVCRLLAERCGGSARGRLVCTGVGKAGLVAHKVAATCASTGTPAFFLHPAEARHGDLGMVQAEDVVLAWSNSGRSEEVVALLEPLRSIGVALVAVVGDPDSPLARHADHVLDYGRIEEACPLRLAPSTSTTLMMALGDALALAVLQLRDFTAADYARFHPGGNLGRRLMTCGEAMRRGEGVVAVAPATAVTTVIQATSRARAGSAILVDDDHRVCGIFTDGDLRRALADHADDPTILARPVADLATSPCTTIRTHQLVSEAQHLCAERHFEDLPVVDGEGRLVGLIDLQDLAQRGFAPTGGHDVTIG